MKNIYLICASIFVSFSISSCDDYTSIFETEGLPKQTQTNSSDKPHVFEGVYYVNDNIFDKVYIEHIEKEKYRVYTPNTWEEVAVIKDGKLEGIWAYPTNFNNKTKAGLSGKHTAIYNQDKSLFEVDIIPDGSTKPSKVKWNLWSKTVQSGDSNAEQIHKRNNHKVGSVYDEYDDIIGTCFYVAESIVATNYHVLEGNSDCYARFGKSKKKIPLNEYVAVDPIIDLVLVECETIKEGTFDFCRDEIVVGSSVYVIGNPFGLQSSISEGIISGLNRTNSRVQITASSYPGNSGSPVLNSKSQLVGIVTEGYDDNLTFAISLSQITFLLGQLHEPRKIEFIPNRY